MIELIFSVCLITEPNKCKDIHQQIAESNITPQQCVHHGQIEMSKWTETHPDWKVIKWGCERPSKNI